MRIAKVVSISLPPDMTEEIQQIAKEERRSVSEVFREAIRQYAASRDLTNVRKEARKTVRKSKVTQKQLRGFVVDKRLK